jgi:hypothetical protein
VLKFAAAADFAMKGMKVSSPQPAAANCASAQSLKLQFYA